MRVRERKPVPGQPAAGDAERHAAFVVRGCVDQREDLAGQRGGAEQRGLATLDQRPREPRDGVVAGAGALGAGGDLLGDRARRRSTRAATSAAAASGRSWPASRSSCIASCAAGSAACPTS